MSTSRIGNRKVVATTPILAREAAKPAPHREATVLVADIDSQARITTGDH
jgi:hypothetical protein